LKIRGCAGRPGEKERMAGEADFAFRQALALCPYNPEAMNSHAEFLKKQNRNSDAALVSEMEKQFPKQKWSEMR
jgi:Flp pilus assembly protein TadD